MAHRIPPDPSSLDGDGISRPNEPAARATKILLFEDKLTDRLLFSTELSGELGGAGSIEVVGTLADGLDLLASRPFDLALLDLDLPDSRGLNSLERLRREAPDLPIIILTGRHDSQLASSALRLGAQDYLVKGELAVRAIARIINNAIDRQVFRVARSRLVRELAASEARVRAIIDANADALVIVDPRGTVRFVNPAAAQMFGRAAAALLGHSLGFPIATDQINEVDVVRDDGRVGQAEMRVVEIQWEEKSALLLSLRDITERKLADAALRASEADFRVLSDAMPQIVWTMRGDGCTTYLNQQWVDYTGLPAEAGLGHGWYQPFHPDDRQRVRDAWQQGKDRGLFSLECRISRVDGVWRWWLLRGTAMRDADGRIMKWVGTCTDIHDLKIAEFQLSQVNGELRRQRTELQALFDLVPAMIWFKDTKNNILRVNQRVVDVAGRKAEDLEGKSMFEIYPGEAAHYYADDLLVIGSGVPKHGIVEKLHDGKGSYTWIQTEKVPYRDEDGKVIGVVVMAQDVTERKRDQEELRELNTRLEDRVRVRTAELHLARDEAVQANRAKSDFLATMSHEIRTPMNGVIAMIEVLTQTHLDHDQMEMTDLIRNSALSLLGIVDNILDLSKIEAGKLTVESRPMRLRETLETVCAMLQHIASQRHVQMTLVVDPAIPRTILGDEGRLRQLLVNLAGNAIKFSGGREQPGHVLVRAVLRDRQTDGVMVDLIVADDGIGIDKAALPKLFLAFSQADISTTRRFGGSGLGLAISGKLAQLMNGSISVQSVLDHGSTFTVRLKFSVPDGADTRIEAAGAQDGLVSGGAHRALPAATSVTWETVRAPQRDDALTQGRLILVAEDNETNRNVISRQLRLIGFAADVARDGCEALQLWRSGDYALLLTDLHMPLMDGYALARSIRAEEIKCSPRRTPIIALTANALLDEERRCLAAGMDAYISKPVGLEKLKTSIEAWLGPSAEVPAVLQAPKAAVETTMPDATASCVDLNVLTAMIGNDPANVDDVLRNFRKSAALSSVELTDAAIAGSGPEMSDVAHKLKSAARSIGALHLGELCAQIEAAADNGESQNLETLLTRFLSESADVFRYLDTRFATASVQ